MSALAVIYLVLFGVHSTSVVVGRARRTTLAAIGFLMVLVGAGLAVVVIA